MVTHPWLKVGLSVWVCVGDHIAGLVQVVERVCRVQMHVFQTVNKGKNDFSSGAY